MLDILTEVDARWRRRFHKDGRTWKQRVQRLHANWAPIMDGLADAYIHWKYPDSRATQEPSPHPPSPDITDYSFAINVVDLYMLTTTAIIPRLSSSRSVPEALIESGYMAVSPDSPSIAVSLKTLELFYRIRRRKPSFSAEAFAKVLSDLYGVRADLSSFLFYVTIYS
jgi:hypothetical protein